MFNRRVLSYAVFAIFSVPSYCDQLLEESRLRRRIFGIVKINQPNANQPEPLLRTKPDSFPQ